MTMERDFPIGRRAAIVLIVGLVVMGVLGVALFGGLLPGLKPNYAAPNVTTLDGHLYYLQTTLLKAPFLTNTSAPWNVSFRDVTFTLWLTDWYSVSGGLVHGTGTEANGSASSFTLGILSNGSRPALYLSPDDLWAVEWSGGWLGGQFVQLLVRA